MGAQVEDRIFPPDGLRRVDGAKIYPWDRVGPPDESWHQNGEIWSGVLWSIYRRLGGDSSDFYERRVARGSLL